MAIVANVELYDDYGRTSRKQVELTSATLADAKGVMAAWATDFLALSDLGILAITYSERDVTEAAAPQSGANADVGATFKVQTDTGKGASHKIPGIKASFVGGQGTIDVSQNAVVTYFGQYDSGEDCRLSDGESVAVVLSGQLDS